MTLDINQIAPGLYQGSYPPHGDAVRRAGFDVLCLCAEEHQPNAAAYPGVEVLRVRLDDGRFRPGDKRNASMVAREVARRVRRGKSCLVTCAAGRNRSGLVVALAMHLLDQSVSPDAIIARIKARRADALTNPWFNDAIRNDLKIKIRETGT